jgi:hypothetical protein
MIALKSFGPNDFEKLMSWIDNEEMLVQFAGGIFSFPLTVEQLDTYVSDSSRHCYKVVELPDHQVVGHAELNFVTIA